MNINDFTVIQIDVEHSRRHHRKYEVEKNLDFFLKPTQITKHQTTNVLIIIIPLNYTWYWWENSNQWSISRASFYNPSPDDAYVSCTKLWPLTDSKEDEYPNDSMKHINGNTKLYGISKIQSELHSHVSMTTKNYYRILHSLFFLS